MTLTVFFVVMLAAVMHAIWNALVKSGGDKFGVMLALISGHMPAILAVVFFVPFPASESWPLLGASVVLHLGYQFFLLYSYSLGDLSQVYPIARGSAPAIVTVISIFVLGIAFSPWQVITIAMVVAGVVGLGLVQNASNRKLDAKSASDGNRALLVALGTGCFIAGYSLVDGFGVRSAGSVLGFYAWQGIINIAIFLGIAAFVRPGAIGQILGANRRVFWIGGSASFLAYAMVMWAFTQAPIALVTALRETSILFAVLIGVVFMGEKVSAMKAAMIALIVLGAIGVKLMS